MKSTFIEKLLGSVLASSMLFAAGLAHAHHPAQHPGEGGHLIGTGEYGNLEFLSVERVTNINDTVADVAVSPDGQWAFLANWGQPDCPGPETGGQTSPDAGAWVIDISDLANPNTVGFIPAHQDSRPGEGMQVVNITTKQFSGDVLVMNNEQCGPNGKGGVSLWDVTDPLKPVKLSEHFGDQTGTIRSDKHENHSVFAWDTGPTAYVVIVDNDEDPDVDILDITNPKRPRLIAELDLEAMFPQIAQTTPDNLSEIFLHDMVVKKIGNDWIMLLSYWDGGYVQLNVNDPVNPTLIGDTDYEEIDPLLEEATGIEAKPEGNGHQNEFTIDNKYFIGTDEDFAPFGITGFGIATNNAGFQGAYPSSAVGGAAAVAALADHEMNGLVVYGGYGCPDSAPVPTPESIAGYLPRPAGEEKIIVLQRGPVGDPSAPEDACFPGEKAHEAFLAGWEAVLFVERHEGAESPPFCGSGAFVDDIVGLCTTHEVLHRLFNTAPFVGPYAFSAYPDGPAISQVSVDKISAFADFDGWGYVHLFENTLDADDKFPDLDTFAIPEAHEEDKGIGFGALSVHEVATDPQDSKLAYLSYYAGGVRAIEIVERGGGAFLCETGGYLDPGGNEFWGVEAFIRDGDTIVLGSDMDSGLWIFRSLGNDNCLTQ